MRLVYFGSGAFGRPAFDALCAHHDVVLAVTQPDRPAGRKRRLTPPPIADAAVAHDVPRFAPENVNTDDATARIHDADADAFVVIAYGQKLSARLLGETFAINLHGSLLPRWRGAAPINWAILDGDRTTGVTVITLAQRMDAGLMLAKAEVEIDPMETAGELHDRLATLGPQAVTGVLDDFAADRLHGETQDESLATHARKLTKADGRLTFDHDAAWVRRRVHGLTPWPGCTVAFDGRAVKILRVDVVDADRAAGPPGEVTADGGVACASGVVRLLEVQPAGGRPMSFDDFVRGAGVEPGARFTTLDD